MALQMMRSVVRMTAVYLGIAAAVTLALLWTVWHSHPLSAELRSKYEDL